MGPVLCGLWPVSQLQPSHRPVCSIRGRQRACRARMIEAAERETLNRRRMEDPEGMSDVQHTLLADWGCRDDLETLVPSTMPSSCRTSSR